MVEYWLGNYSFYVKNSLAQIGRNSKNYFQEAGISVCVISYRHRNRPQAPGEPVPSVPPVGHSWKETLCGFSFQRSLRSLPSFPGACGTEFMGGCSLEGWQGQRVSPPPVGGGTCKRVLLQECPGPPSAMGPRGRFRRLFEITYFERLSFRRVESLFLMIRNNIDQAGLKEIPGLKDGTQSG